MRVAGPAAPGCRPAGGLDRPLPASEGTAIRLFPDQLPSERAGLAVGVGRDAFRSERARLSARVVRLTAAALVLRRQSARPKS